MKRLFRGGSVVSGSKIEKADVLTEGEVILAVGENLSDPEFSKDFQDFQMEHLKTGG